ncbi:MAG: hypothetical protein AB1714_15530 [Acidobacteriota bacterium]
MTRTFDAVAWMRRRRIEMMKRTLCSPGMTNEIGHGECSNKIRSGSGFVTA